MLLSNGAPTRAVPRLYPRSSVAIKYIFTMIHTERTSRNILRRPDPASDQPTGGDYLTLQTNSNPEADRLQQAREANVPWRKWGPYLSERQWGTVREDYSQDGNAWNYFTHDQARSPRSITGVRMAWQASAMTSSFSAFPWPYGTARTLSLKSALGLTITTKPNHGVKRSQGVLLLPRQHADPLVHEVFVQVSAGGLPI